MVRNLNHDNDVDNIEKEHKELTQDNKFYEFDIIFSPDTIVKPFAMMVKILYTSMALVAMKGLVTDASFAQIAKVFIFFWLKMGSGRILNFLQMLELN